MTLASVCSLREEVTAASESSNTATAAEVASVLITCIKRIKARLFWEIYFFKVIKKGDKFKITKGLTEEIKCKMSVDKVRLPASSKCFLKLNPGAKLQLDYKRFQEQG